MAERKLKLVPAALPPRASRATGKYAEMVREFVDAGYESARVEGNAKPATIVAGLKKAAISLSLPVKVATREDGVYLVKR
jgi:hypothetical protein